MSNPIELTNNLIKAFLDKTPEALEDAIDKIWRDGYDHGFEDGYDKKLEGEKE